MLISIIFPMFNEENNVDELFDRIYLNIKNLSSKWEIIAINNGSVDKTAQRLDKIIRDSKSKKFPYNDLKINVITLTRNFGYDNAILTGIEKCKGDYVIIMDGDLQDPPEEIPRFLNKIKEGYDIVYGIRNKRTESIPIKIFISIYYFIWSRISIIKFPKNAGNFCVLSRIVVNEINSLTEVNQYFRGIRAWFGYKSCGLIYERKIRKNGNSKFSFLNYFIYGIEGITSFSTVPIRFLTILGFFGIILSFFIILLIIIQKFLSIFYPSLYTYYIMPGWTSLMILTIISLSINLIGLGIIGEYIARILEEVKKRPKAVIKSLKTNK